MCGASFWLESSVDQLRKTLRFDVGVRGDVVALSKRPLRLLSRRITRPTDKSPLSLAGNDGDLRLPVELGGLGRGEPDSKDVGAKVDNVRIYTAGYSLRLEASESGVAASMAVRSKGAKPHSTR